MIISLLISTLNLIFTVISSVEFILFSISIIIIYNLHQFYFKDRKNIKIHKNFQDPENLSLENLKIKPVVNIIVPAWKEGIFFKDLLYSIKNLSYPNLKVIINAGGSEETLNIAKTFKKYENFIILHQKGGADRPSLGKIKALNECISYISEGIVYFMDADSYLTDEILLRMIYPIVNLNEDIVMGTNRPLKSQEKKGLVKYLLVDRYHNRKRKYVRYVSEPPISGANLCLKFEVIKSIGRFSENRKFATDRSMGIDIYSKGYTSYVSYDYRNRIHVDYPCTIVGYIHQKTVWIENSLIYKFKNNKLSLVKFVVKFFISLYLLIFPFLIFINFSLFFIGILILLSIYFMKIRKLFFFTTVFNQAYYEKYEFGFFLKLFYYIYVDAVIILRIPFHFLIFLRKLKK